MYVEKKHILIACLVLAVIAVGWYVFRQPRDGAERALDESIRRVGTEQQRASESIGRAESGLERSLDRIGELEELTRTAEGNARSIEDRIDRMQKRADDGAKLIERSQRRIEQYRSWCKGH